MKARLIIGMAAISLIAAGAAGAVVTNGVIEAHNGDRVVVNKNLGCFVGPSDIVCGGASQSRISADIRTNGEILIQIQPTPHGVYPGLFVQRATCSSPGVCHLVLGK